MNNTIKWVVLALIVIGGGLGVAWDRGFFATKTNNNVETISPPPKLISVQEYSNQTSDKLPEISIRTRNILDAQYKEILAKLAESEAISQANVLKAELEIKEKQASIQNENKRLSLEERRMNDESRLDAARAPLKSNDTGQAVRVVEFTPQLVGLSLDTAYITQGVGKYAVKEGQSVGNYRLDEIQSSNGLVVMRNSATGKALNLTLVATGSRSYPQVPALSVANDGKGRNED